jgi:predicted amidohydrolase
MKPFAIAGLQLELANSDNLDLVSKKIRTALARYPWVQMVVLSELAICGAGAGQAEPLPSPAENRLGEIAGALGIWLVSGSLYEKDGAAVYNTATVFDPAGEIVTRYRKMYPFYPYEAGVEAGGDICTFDVPDVGRFGLSICYDIHFPEVSRALATAGAEVLIHPTLTNSSDRDIELAMIRATAAQQQMYVIDVNAAGDQGYGKSMFAGPEGEVLHEASSTEEIMPIEVDLDRVRRVRERGLQGLGQTLKSYRDAGHRFPQENMANQADYLDTLGPLEMPKRGG